MKIAVIGDVLIDQYVEGVVERISPEAPVPVLKFTRSHTTSGGAGNVFENIRSLTSNVVLCTSSPHPPLKTRFVADGHYLLRVDHESDVVWNDNEQWRDADIIVVSDYNKGAITNSRWLTAKQARIIVDPKKDLSFYTGVWCIKPNRKEFEAFYGKWTTNDQLRGLMEDASRDLNIPHFIVTLGQDGVAYRGPTGWILIPSEAREVFDVTGAGDTFTAVLAYAVSQGLDMIDAIKLANKGSGVAVSHRGTYVITPADLNDGKKQTVVFTNGCFDVLHRGHIDYLKQSRQLGDKLIVGLNSDRSVRELKGSSRPINSQEDRKYILENLPFVDQVIIFDEPTPLNLIKQIQPDIITKGGDYQPENVVGYTIVPRTVILPFTEGQSTSSIIERARK